MIISVSRRCDIPRFAFDWFMERLDAGFVEVKNPFNSSQVRQVSLLPPFTAGIGESAELFAFWTRDPSSILKHSEELEKRGYTYYVMTTLNSYPALLEPNAPQAETVIRSMRLLAQMIGPERVIWRYDPVFLSNITAFDFHLRNFSDLASRLSGAVNRVIVSVYDEYTRAERRIGALEQSGLLKRLPHYESDPAMSGPKAGEIPKQLVFGRMIHQLLAEFAGIAQEHGMEIQSCAENDLRDCGIKAGACIDGEYIERVFGLKAPAKDRGQRRPNCLCVQSVDIGTYGHCLAGCVYCYASS